MSNEPLPRRGFLKKAGTAVAASCAASPTAPVQSQTATAQPATSLADLVLKNAKVITVDRDFNIARAVAIAGDRILAVGSDAAMAAHIAPATRVVDLKGKTVTPGIIIAIEGPITTARLGANMDDVCPFAATPPFDGEGQLIPTQGHRAGETAPVRS
jgi:hypothetical protein